MKKKPWKLRPQPPVDVLVRCDKAVKRLQEAVGRINELIGPPRKGRPSRRRT